jgi:hypothetical protein
MISWDGSCIIEWWGLYSISTFVSFRFVLPVFRKLCIKWSGDETSADSAENPIASSAAAFARHLHVSDFSLAQYFRDVSIMLCRRSRPRVRKPAITHEVRNVVFMYSTSRINASRLRTHCKLCEHHAAAPGIFPIGLEGSWSNFMTSNREPKLENSNEDRESTP